MIVIAALFLFSFVTIKALHQEPYPAKTLPLFDTSGIFVNTIIDKKVKSQRVQGQDIIFRGSSSGKKVALTFDADMTPEMLQQLNTGFYKSSYNEKLIDVLRMTNTKATFFMSGLWIEKYPAVAKSFAETPLFELANHSYSHPSFEGFCYGLRAISEIETVSEVEKTQQLLWSMTGRENKFFRFPGGCYSQQDLAMLKKLGLTAIQWDVEGQDGFNHDARNIEQNVLKNVRNGSIIVLHMNGYPNSPLTATALPRIIAELRIRGYEFVKVSELLEDTNDSQELAANSPITKNIILSYK